MQIVNTLPIRSARKGRPQQATPAASQDKFRSAFRDAAIDGTVGGLSACAGWALARVNPFLGIGAGAVLGAVAPRPAGSPYDEDGQWKRATGALFGALCGMAGACGGPLTIPVAAGFGAFRGMAGHVLYPDAR